MAHRLIVLTGLFLLALAAPASAHELTGSHTDTRTELGSLDIAETVEMLNGRAADDADGLPRTWCGEPRTTDNVEDAAFDPALRQFKLVYAYPSDRPSRFAQWRDALQADVALIGQFVGAQSGGRKAPRFDMGTSCGPEYADIQVVALPSPRSTYVDDFNTLHNDVRARLTHQAGQPRNVVVLADTLSGYPVGYWSGLGSHRVDERPGADNSSNTGGLRSALYVPDGEPAPGADPDGWWPEGMLHEMTHNLGAVGADAPHSTEGGHCTDGHDVMCYADGTFPASELTRACDQIPGVMTQVYDCGGDDYFNVAPPAGTYLADNWNVYDNVFLGSCAAIAPACGGDSPGTIPEPPVATADPVVSGAARVGALLTVSRGTWLNAPDAYGYEWERGEGSEWETIPGATGTAYTPTSADTGVRLRVRVVATNADGSTAATSEATSVVGAAPTAPVLVPVPAVSVFAPPAPPAPSTPAAAVAGPSTGRAALKVAVGRGKGKRLATIAFAVSRGTLKSSRPRVALAKGRYEVRLCTTAGASPSRPRCAKRRVRVRGGARTRLPALSVAVPAGSTGRVAYTVTAVGRLFSARTAAHARSGVLLG